MFLANKIGWAGVALALLTTGILIPGSPPGPARPGSHQENAGPFVTKNEIIKMQETLHNKGYYQGEVDGIFGLRTRSSIRAYQKAEKLPFTGQVDTWTAGRLGIRPESTWGNSESARQEVAGETVKAKPSPYIKWATSSRRASKTLRKKVSKSNAIDDNRGYSANQRQAENLSHEQ